ncbi:4-hydroxyphenylacetate 3-hydroxylase family protein [Ferviditalea candida]|uniref:4-hydroxyphenylacetate 3-hydroxylase N-terminal domain-containing protein n=1 Tax=Ferviditalea candida TaxID=3108399 RepID=A0ABU5ZNC1_9BACL|nr:4-hydroxyphenylacetate 3-hydroxylase N-terminal domain-containing protein [Paenibacillaceae bacterium T2]
MSTDQRVKVAARTGKQFLEGLASQKREIWLDGEKITNPLEHEQLALAAKSMARIYDFQHEHASDLLASSPDDGSLVNATHIIPRSREDLIRRRKAIEMTAALSGGTMGRTPDYLNVTFACFAGRSDVWARRNNETGAANIVNYQKIMRDRDLSTTHALMNPQVDRSKPEAEQAMGEVSLHKVGETDDSIIVRGARMLATLATYADELTVYPGSDLRTVDKPYALSFALPVGTPGLKFVCRGTYAKTKDPFDYPLSHRFDEMDAMVIFDDVEVPKDRVFLDGDTVGYSEVITDTGWRGHIMHQAFTRAYVKLSFAFGLGHVIANATGVVKFDHIQEKLGQMWNMVELTRSAITAAEAGATPDEQGVWCPDDRPFLALRGEMPKWMPKANELLQLIGGGGFMLTPSRADVNGPLKEDIAKYFQAAGADAERRIRLFRLAWDFVGSELGGRGELYERFYLSDSWRMTSLAYKIANKDFATSLVEQFLKD